MSDFDFDKMVCDSFMTDNAQNLKDTLESKIKDIESEFKSKLDKLETTLKGKTDRFEAYIESKPLVVNFGTIEKPKNEITHKAFDTIIKILSSQKRIDKNIMLVGPAGSSKTTLTRQVADALGLEYVCMSVGQQTTVSNLLGFINATGQYNSTVLRDAFENGKLICLDEFDSANPSTVTILNAMLSNGVCSFPDKMVKKHPKFICMICCNTYGTGADLNYIGRNRLDASTLDRFISVRVDYDENLESALADNKQWVNAVRKMRDNVKRHGVKAVISPRASMQGADLLDVGFSIEDVLEMVIFKGMTQDARSKIIQDVDLSVFSKKVKKNKNKAIDDNPMTIKIDFNKCEYSVRNVIADTSIVTGVDWNGEYSIYLSANCGYDDKLEDRALYLNAGINHTLKIRNHRCIEQLMRELELYCSSIRTEYQDIILEIVYLEHSYKFKLSRDSGVRLDDKI